jgi:phosphatidylglycerophosphate synthase
MPVMRLRDLCTAASAISALRLPIAVACPWLVHSEWVLPVYLFALATDVLDGVVARRTRTESPAGAVFDAWMDKVLHVNLAWSLAIADRIPDAWMLAWFARELIQIAIFLPLMHRFRVGVGAPPATSVLGRLTAGALALTVIVVLLGADATVLTVVTGALSVGSGLDYARVHLVRARRGATFTSVAPRARLFWSKDALGDGRHPPEEA